VLRTGERERQLRGRCDRSAQTLVKVGVKIDSTLVPNDQATWSVP
jgi:hypothetical protein